LLVTVIANDTLQGKECPAVSLRESSAIDDQARALQSLGGAPEGLNFGDEFVVHDDLLGLTTTTTKSTFLR